MDPSIAGEKLRRPGHRRMHEMFVAFHRNFLLLLWMHQSRVSIYIGPEHSYSDDERDRDRGRDLGRDQDFDWNCQTNRPTDQTMVDAPAAVDVVFAVRQGVAAGVSSLRS